MPSTFSLCKSIKVHSTVAALCRGCGANHFAHWASLVIGMISGEAQQAAGALAHLTINGLWRIVCIALHADGHAKDVLADANMLGGSPLLVQALIDVRLEDATMMMHCLKAALAVEGIALLALAHCSAVAALAALDVHHNVTHCCAV